MKELSETNKELVLAMPKFGEQPIRLCKSHSVSWLEEELMENMWTERKGLFPIESYGTCTKFLASLQVIFSSFTRNMLTQIQ